MRGTCREHQRKAAGKIIRHCLQQLEVLGIVGKITYEGEEGGSTHIEGKTLTKKGTTDMDRIASKIAKEMRKKK